MFPVEKKLVEALAERKQRGLLRGLTVMGKTVDFSSNDYLGFARSKLLTKMIREEERKWIAHNGSGGSRLLTGNSHAAIKLEVFLARYHRAPAALLFNSGYDANVGLFSSVASKNDTIIYDELIHASVRDGIRLSRAQSFPFRHNDTKHLHERMEMAKGNIFVAVESVYSMDGDFARLTEIIKLCRERRAHLIVDEAHATGVFSGGLLQKAGFEKDVFARVHTFGKALGCHGATVVGSTTLKEFLVNHARSFIYTTALPPHSVHTIRAAYRLLEQSHKTLKKLHDLIAFFEKRVRQRQVFQLKNGEWKWLSSSSAIQCLLVPGNSQAKELAKAIGNGNLDVRPILSPTVPKGKERIRVCLHAYNKESEINRLFEIIGDEAHGGLSKSRGKKK